MPVFSIRNSVFSAMLVLALPLASMADLKVVQKTITQNLPSPAGFGGNEAPSATNGRKPGDPITSTSYFKGKKVRVDEGDKVTVTDNEAGTITSWDVKKKTYTVMKVADLGAQANPIAEFMEVKVDGDVKPTETKKPIAGRDSRLYTSKFTMAMSMKEGAPIPIPAGDGPLMEIIIEGEQWMAEGLQIDSKPALAGVPGVPQGMARMMPGMDALLKKMSAVKGFPLATLQKMTFKSSLPLPFLPEKPTTVKSETISVSEDALPDTLFAVPSGFKQVEPELPGFPGLGGGA